MEFFWPFLWKLKVMWNLLLISSRTACQSKQADKSGDFFYITSQDTVKLLQSSLCNVLSNLYSCPLFSDVVYTILHFNSIHDVSCSDVSLILSHSFSSKMFSMHFHIDINLTIVLSPADSVVRTVAAARYLQYELCPLV